MESKEEILERLRKIAGGISGSGAEMSGDKALQGGRASGETAYPAGEAARGQVLPGEALSGQTACSVADAARESAFRDAMSRAVRLLSGRNHPKAELDRKLRQRGIEGPLVVRVIRECERLNYIDDRATAGYYLAELKRKGYGSEKIRATMVRKGLDADLVEELMAGCFDREEEVRNAARMLEKKLGTFRRETDLRKRRAKIYRYLYARGFSGSTITEVIEAHGDERD